MALNVRVAMLICTAFIGGMSWVLQQARMPQLELPPPLVVYTPRGGGPAATATGGARQTDEWREGWVRRFDRPSSVALQTAPEPVAQYLALAELAENAAGELPPLNLPPLVYDPREDELPLAGDTELAGVGGEGSRDRDGSGVFADQLSGDPPTEVVASAVPVKRYRVVKGDTLAGVARREWKSADGRLVRLLVDVNPELAGRQRRLLVGQELVIPDGDLARRVLAGATVRADSLAQGAAVAQAESAKAAETSGVRWYTIQPKDSLRSIAKRHLNDSRRWREISNLNRMANPNRLQPGMRIKLPPTLRLASR